MNRVIHILILFIVILLLGFVSCKKLPRDNPLDGLNNSGSADGVSLKYSKYVVVADGNNDGIINQNEVAYLRVYVKNNGTKTAYGVQAVISSASNYVSSIIPTSEVEYDSQIYGNDIQSGYEKFGYYASTQSAGYTFSFKVAQNTPAGTVITFDMVITDQEGHEWNDSFQVTVDKIGATLNYSKHSVVFDDNQDGIVNQNETIYLRVYIKNNGTSNANGVEAKISTTSTYISNIVPSVAVDYNSQVYGNDIQPGYEKYGYFGSAPSYSDFTISFKVAKNTPAGTIITFTMDISDEAGNQWNDTFEISVNEINAILNYSKHSVVYDDNQDGVINQNETAFLRVYIKNNGTSTANDVKAIISSSSSYVSNINPTSLVSYNSQVYGGNISPGYEKYGYFDSAPNYTDYTVSFLVGANVPGGTIITFNVDITDEAGNEWQDTFAISIN